MKSLNNVTDTLTYVAGLGAGYAGISSVPAVTQPVSQGSLLTAVIAFLTVFLQAFIMYLNSKQKSSVPPEIADVQRQITEIKSRLYDCDCKQDK